jgi:xylulose-5-phosphate/fructose-6-phosphate phosphoketolase
LALHATDRLPQTAGEGVTLKQQLQHKLVEHKQYIAKHSEDRPETCDWHWSNNQ